MAGSGSVLAAREPDLKKACPDLPALPAAAEIDEAKRAAMATFSANYPARTLKPNGKGISEEQLQITLTEVRRVFSLDQGGRVIQVDNEDAKPQPDLTKPAGLNGDFIPQLMALAKAYAGCSPAQAPAIEDTYRALMRLWLKHAPQSGQPMLWMGNGYSWRNKGPKFLEMAHLLTPEETDDVADSLMYLSGGSMLLATNPESSTDLQLNYYPTMLQAVSRIAEPRRKWQRLLALRRGLDLAVTRGNLVTPDGGIIHHAGHHIAYGGYSFASILTIQTVFTRSGIMSPDSPGALSRFTRAVDAWAWTTLQGEIPPVFQLRPGPVWDSAPRPGQAPGRTIDFATRTAELASATDKRADISSYTALARLAASKAAGNPKTLPAAWQPLATPEFMQPLSGHRPFPVMGAAIHRRDDWTVVVRGANQSWRGGEVYAGPEYPGAYLDEIMQGALFVFSGSSPGNAVNVADSGFAAEGYNPNLFPNASSEQLDNVARAGRGNPDYLGSGAKQGGGVDLAGNGMWSWQPAHCRKSAFFFGNRITLVTRNLNLKGEVCTGLLQMRHSNPETHLLGIDNVPHGDAGEWTLPGTTAHTLIDANRTGYYLPAGNPDLTVRRGVQQWTYAIPQYLKPGIDPKSLPPLKNRKDLTAALPNYLPSEGFFSTAWFNHGKNPANAGCEFTVLVRTDPKALQAFAKAAADPKTAPYSLKTSDTAHEFYDRESGTRCVATFADDAPFEADAITAVNRPATLMWRQDGGRLEGSLGATDLKDTRPFIVRLKGRWSAGAALPEGSKLIMEGADSRLEIPYRDQTAVKFSLNR